MCPGFPLVALPGDGPLPATPITAPFTDVAAIDSSGLACTALPPNSLAGAVALILRGNCTFQIKVQRAKRGSLGSYRLRGAGFAGRHSDGPRRRHTAVGNGQLQRRRGHQAKSGLNAGAGRYGARSHFHADYRHRLAFPRPAPAWTPASSWRSPLWAADIYVATQKLDVNGEIRSSGYILVDGTSPPVAVVRGAAQERAARPDGGPVPLAADDTGAAVVQTGWRCPAQQSGGDARCQRGAELHRSRVAGFAQPGQQPSTITNLSGSDDTFTIAATPRPAGRSPL